MIIGIKNTDVESHRYKDDPITGLTMNVNLHEVKVSGENVQVRFSYLVFYDQGIGMLRVDGTLYAKEDTKGAKAIAEAWKEDRKLPSEFAEAVINTINYSSGTEGTFFTRPLNLAPPILPPKIDVSSLKSRKV